MKALIDSYFILQGIDNGRVPFQAKFTLQELLSNSGTCADTEFFYTLQENQSVLNLHEYESIYLPVSRDNENSVGVLSRVNKQDFNDFEIQEG